MSVIFSLVNTTNADYKDGETFSPCSDFSFLSVLLCMPGDKMLNPHPVF